MPRILDIDLDFFLDGVAHWRSSSDGRLDDEYRPWETDAALTFLRDQCGLADPLPGFVVEHHGELFARWRQAIEAGNLHTPFHVTHVDAHADLGLGDAGYVQIMSDLLFRAPHERTYPATDTYGLGDGNYLAFAVACRWISSMEYVCHPGSTDLLYHHMKDFDCRGDALQLKAVTHDALNAAMFSDERPTVTRLEPEVPFSMIEWPSYKAAEPFDFVCLCRSPGFTPATADPLFDLIRHTFIREVELGA